MSDSLKNKKKADRYFIKGSFFIFIIAVLIIALSSSVIVSAKDDATRDKLLGNIKALKESTEDLEKIVREGRLGDLRERINQIKENLDKMVEERSIKQIEKELDKAAEEAKQKRIGEAEKKLDKKTGKETFRRGN